MITIQACTPGNDGSVGNITSRLYNITGPIGLPHRSSSKAGVHWSRLPALRWLLPESCILIDDADGALSGLLMGIFRAKPKQ